MNNTITISGSNNSYFTANSNTYIIISSISHKCHRCGELVREATTEETRKESDAVNYNQGFYHPECAIQQILEDHKDYFANPEITFD